VRAAALAALFLLSPAGGAAAGDSLADLAMDLRLNPGDGQPAPPFTLPALDGQRVSLAELKGQVVLLYFWATW
jgi:cytochrome oxidase Cu insertion factor (SCO1/SenC/PrrC family)